MVNGKGPFRFLFDTGVSVCVLHRGFVNPLELESLGATEIGDPSGNARCPAQVGRLAIRSGSVRRQIGCGV